MTIQQIYNLAIKMGIESDFRDEQEIKKMLERLKEKYNRMSEEEKKEFDVERLKNPYSDTRILFGDPQKEVKKILIGIDIDGEELLLADKMSDIDLVISHHPRGKALSGLDDVMQLQVDVLAQYGVPINIAEKLLNKRIEEVARGISPANHNRAVDMARHLNLPFMCVHTPCDNLVAKFVDEKLKKDKPVFLGEIIKSLKKVPEYQEAITIGAGPEIFIGSKESRCGKIVLTEITGGTEGAPEIYEKLAQVGAGTIIGMHMSEKHMEEAKKANVNVVIAGHISSDNIGINLFLDEVEKKVGEEMKSLLPRFADARGIEIVACSGLIRIKR